jgi:hypothetical protein
MPSDHPSTGAAKMTLLLLRLTYTIFLVILIPVYWINYGPGNFLWLSDISLFLTFFALWLRSPLCISIMLVAIFPFELVWNIDFFFQLLTGNELIGLAAYMFDPEKTLFLRGLSLFHVFLPIIWIGYYFKWGYDHHALAYGTALCWIAFIASFLLTDPQKNINWVYYPLKHGWTWINSTEWTMALLLVFPLCIYWPMHLLLKRVGNER